ncbi:MAG: extensin family protein [Roseibium sp.]|nr:extensin family protein [Roseibium sp.]
MKKLARQFCVFAAVGLSLSPAVFAKDPLPPVRPLGNADQNGFLEGVDVPPVKPARTDETADPEERSDSPARACSIPNGVYETVPAFKGEADGDPECGVQDPVKLTGVRGASGSIKFSMPALLSCDFAAVLVRWLHEDVLPTSDLRLPSSIASLANGPGYQCRRRNNLPDGKLSEHALGKAIDLSGFMLADGSLVSVETDWGSDTIEGRFLKSVHRSACERFTTVLGPDADDSHKSHMHVDIGCHGKTCTYLICQ